MKTIFNWALGKILSILANSNVDELLVVVKYVIEAAGKFSSSQDKRDWVISQIKDVWAEKEESTIRFLIETALKYNKYITQKK